MRLGGPPLNARTLGCLKEGKPMGHVSNDLRAIREAVVRRHIDAENEADLDAMIASFHRPRYDVVPMGAVCEGEAAVRELVRGLVTAFP